MIRHYIIILTLVVLSGCKEVYDPDIDTDETALVIQGVLTNYPGELVIKINRAVPFDSSDNRIPVKGARVSVVDNNGQIYPLYETESGSYSNYSLAGEPNQSYYLKVLAPDGNEYQSELQTMSQPYRQDSIYAENSSYDFLLSTGGSDFLKVERKGIETFVDLSSGGTELPKCRYDLRTTVLYTYTIDGIPPPTVYCWRTFNPVTKVNITSSKFDKTIGIISRHSLSFFGTEIGIYDERPNLTVIGWLLTVNKYNLSRETHQYYLDIKKQLEASGRIFDPVPSQILGNMKCINNPKKLVFGFFEVSHVEKQYYRYKFEKGILMVPKDNFPGFTNEGEVIGVPPPFWSY